MSVEIVDGVVPEYLAAASKIMEAEAAAEFEQNVRGMYDQMERIAITVANGIPTLSRFRMRTPRSNARRMRVKLNRRIAVTGDGMSSDCSESLTCTDCHSRRARTGRDNDGTVRLPSATD